MIDLLIPRHILFADPEKFLVKISPCGKYLSYLAPCQGELNLWIAPIDAREQAVALTQCEDPVRDYYWTKDSQRLLYICDNKGDENWQLSGVEIASKKITSYTEPGYQARILQMSAKKPHQIAIALNQRDIHFHDVYILDLNSGQKTCIYENQRFWDFIVDNDLQLRVAIQVNTKSGEMFDMSQAEQPLGIANLSQLDLLDLYFYPRLRMGISADNQILYLAQSVDTNTAGIYALNLNSKHLQLLGNDPTADICDILFDPKTNQPQAYAINNARKHWHALTEQGEKDLAFLQALDNGDMEILSQTSNNEHWIVAFTHDNGPIHFYLYHRNGAQADLLFTSHKAFTDLPLTKMQAVEIKMRDGLICTSYLSLPRECDLAQRGIPDEPLPLVLMVHGGPTYRDFWGYNPVHQWLANRGYAVLSVNYRASTGFGKAHVAAGNGEWGGKIQQDLMDAVAWAIAEGITTSDKVAIMGRSFGGYATLVGLSMTPDMFCCGVDIVGPANLETMLEHFPPYWKAMSHALYDMLGCDPNTPQGKEFLAKRSPINYANHITKPLLIGHGKNDARVMQSESDHMASAMQANGIPVTYVIFPDEGHQFIHPGNREAFYALAEQFLAKNLGGRSEPFDPNTQTSMQMIADDFQLHPKRSWQVG